MKSLPLGITKAFSRPTDEEPLLPSSTPNPSLYGNGDDPSSAHLAPPDAARYDKNKLRMPVDRRFVLKICVHSCHLICGVVVRYYAKPSTDIVEWPADIVDFNASFTRCLQKIKERHDPTGECSDHLLWHSPPQCAAHPCSHNSGSRSSGVEAIKERETHRPRHPNLA